MDKSVANELLIEMEKDEAQTGCGHAEAGKDYLFAYIGFVSPQYSLTARMPAFIGAVDFRELGRAGMRLLEDRIEKGCGRALCIRIPGEVICWDGKE